MCGIVGYITYKKDAINKAIGVLKKLEYRGYDSAGIGYLDENKKIQIKKAKGKISNLEKQLNYKINSSCAIAHTRWATHGIVNDINAHPHYGKNVVLVQNGIIENYLDIKKTLITKKIKFYSQTDTEVITKLIDWQYSILKDPIKAIRTACKQVKGSYALLMMFKNEPNILYAINEQAPLVIVKNSNNGFVIASDVNSISNFGTNNFWFLKSNELAIVKQNQISFLDAKNHPFKKKTIKVSIDQQKNDKQGFKTFMLKEINEQTNILLKVLTTYVFKDEISFNFNKVLNHSLLKKISKIRIIGCGSAYNSGLLSQSFFSELANIKIELIIASEFRYQKFIKESNILNIIISQSGETADTIASLRLLKEQKEVVIAIVNNVNSTIANEADFVINMNCGIEQAVASTKAYLSTSFILHLLAFYLGKIKNTHQINDSHFIKQAYSDINLGDNVNKNNNVKNVVSKIYKFKNIFFIGRSINYAICSEASLKLKELSYLNANAYPAGELKHGPISLIDDKTLSIAIMANNNELINEKTLSNIKEIETRNGHILLIANKKYSKYLKHNDFFIDNFASDSFFSYIPSIYIAQLLAYYTALKLGNDVDCPRNLAKSVTVE